MMRKALSQMTRRGFFGRLSQAVLVLLGWQFQACASVGRPSDSVAATSGSKISTTVRPPFEMPDPAEMMGDAGEIAQRVQEFFPFLDLDPRAVTQFAEDFVRYRESEGVQMFPLGLRQRFLLSSSFFDDGADEAKRVEYVGFHDPFIAPCSNRLARFVDGAAANNG